MNNPIKITLILFMLILFMLTVFSCKESSKNVKLECLLDSINVDLDNVDILVGQANGWTDTTALILITYHKESIKVPIGSRFKSTYKGHDIFFNQESIDTLNTKKYRRIPNNIKWKRHNPKEMDDDYIVPLYNPIQVQIEYNIKRNCFGNIIRGKGLIKEKSIEKCKCG